MCIRDRSSRKHPLSHNIHQNRFQSADETFHRNHHQNQSHEAHHYIVSRIAQYDGKAQQLTPEWWEMVRFSMEEADRLGLKLGMHICDGFALAGGPWITPEESMQKVVWSCLLYTSRCV